MRKKISFLVMVMIGMQILDVDATTQVPPVQRKREEREVNTRRQKRVNLSRRKRITHEGITVENKTPSIEGEKEEGKSQTNPLLYGVLLLGVCFFAYGVISILKNQSGDDKSDDTLFDAKYGTIPDNTSEVKQKEYNKVRELVKQTKEAMETIQDPNSFPDIVINFYEKNDNYLHKYHFSVAMLSHAPKDENVVAPLYQMGTKCDDTKNGYDIEKIKESLRKEKNFPCYFHFTDDKGLRGILKDGKIENRHKKWLPGAFCSSRPEISYGEYGFCFDRTVEWSSLPQSHRWVDDTKNGKKNNCVWLGFYADIVLDKYLRGIVVRDKSEDLENIKNLVINYLKKRKQALEQQPTTDIRTKKIQFLEKEIKNPTRYKVRYVEDVKTESEQAGFFWEEVAERAFPRCWARLKEVVVYDAKSFQSGKLETNALLTQAYNKIG